MDTTVAKVHGIARYFLNSEDIAEMGKALNYNAEVLKELIEKVNELENKIEELEGR